MRQECAALELGRQTREDAFVSTVLSISSGALLAIPGLLLAKDFVLPPFREGFCLYGGLLAFGVALALALLEQIISGDAYAKQIDVSQKYYRMESRERSHTQSLKRVALLQKACVGSFAVALMLSTIGIITIGSNEHGQSPTTTPSTATTPSTSTATATATATADANPRHVR